MTRKKAWGDLDDRQKTLVLVVVSSRRPRTSTYGPPRDSCSAGSGRATRPRAHVSFTHNTTPDIRVAGGWGWDVGSGFVDEEDRAFGVAHQALGFAADQGAFQGVHAGGADDDKVGVHLV